MSNKKFKITEISEDGTKTETNFSSSIELWNYISYNYFKSEMSLLKLPPTLNFLADTSNKIIKKFTIKDIKERCLEHLDEKYFTLIKMFYSPSQIERFYSNIQSIEDILDKHYSSIKFLNKLKKEK